jgi:hypothetical protein
MLRELKGTQRLPRVLALRVDGTGTASILEGRFDATLTDNGTGDYTLTFAKPFARVPVVVACPLAVDIAVSVGTITKLAVQIKAKTIAGSPAAADVDFHVIVVGSDAVDPT